MSRSRSGSDDGLKLSLGIPMLYKSLVPNDFPELILIDDDDDDDVQICPPASSGEELRFYSYSSTWTPPIREVDLELRLGIGDSTSGCFGISNPAANEVGTKIKDLPSGQYMTSFPEIKLRCAICMDTMKEEASTTCGHLFCKPCITSAVRLRKRCPTCREKLSLGNIHRIYLPGATS